MPPPKCPLLTADVVIVMQRMLVLITRKNPPFEGMYALPGGFVDVGEMVECAAAREVREETSLEVELLDLIGVFSSPDRDPRGHVVSIAYLATPSSAVLRAGDDASAVALLPPNSLPPVLAFDHLAIIDKALRAAKRHKLL